MCILFLLLSLAHGDVSARAGLLVYEYFGNFVSIIVFLCSFVALAGLTQLHKNS
jgi:hypothetical protein